MPAKIGMAMCTEIGPPECESRFPCTLKFGEDSPVFPEPEPLQRAVVPCHQALQVEPVRPT